MNEQLTTPRYFQMLDKGEKLPASIPREFMERVTRIENHRRRVAMEIKKHRGVNTPMIASDGPLIVGILPDNDETRMRLWAFMRYYDESYADVRDCLLRFAMSLVASTKPLPANAVDVWKRGMAKIGRVAQHRLQTGMKRTRLVCSCRVLEPARL